MDHQGKTKVVLLCCGSFNPITNMHLRMFELARDYLEDTGKFEVVKGIISPVGDGYKKKGLIEANHRVEMARLATKSSDWIKVDSWESQQSDWVETTKVLWHHHEELVSARGNPKEEEPVITRGKRKRGDTSKAGGKRRRNDMEDVSEEQTSETNGSRLMLLCGADVLESFGVPRLWKNEDIAEIVGAHGMVCVTRVGNDADAFVHRSDLLWSHRQNIHIVREWVANDISATHVRRALRRGHSVRYLLPELVVQYIQERQLYTTDSEQRNADAVLAPLLRHEENNV